jgi:periplasmic divalent cation tolerance protein
MDLRLDLATAGSRALRLIDAPKWDRQMDRAVFVYTTWPSTVEAEKAGGTLVERRLAACVNILPGMVSVYRWEGKLERAEEAVMIVKTRASLAGEVEAAVKAAHPYSTPAILVMPIEAVEQNYLGWLLAETGGSEP